MRHIEEGSGSLGLHGLPREIIVTESEGSRMEELFRVGIITSAHGLRGEVKVYPTTDDRQRFRDLDRVLMDNGQGLVTLNIESVRFHKNMVLLKFKEFHDISEAEKYKGKDLLITRSQTVELGPDENFIADLIGLKIVTDEGEDFGILKDVLKTGANDVYVIAGNDGKEYLFPVIKQCILDINLESREIKVHIMDGLLDL